MLYNLLMTLLMTVIATAVGSAQTVVHSTTSPALPFPSLCPLSLLLPFGIACCQFECLTLHSLPAALLRLHVEAFPNGNFGFSACSTVPLTPLTLPFSLPWLLECYNISHFRHWHFSFWLRTCRVHWQFLSAAFAID